MRVHGDELDATIDVRETIGTIMLVLALTGSVTVFAGATLGWWASRRALRPLTLIADAARQIAQMEMRKYTNREPKA